MRQTADYHCLH